jgi:porphobilinogen synthase
MALRHAEAGADFVAPSAMMDGQVDAIRSLLDLHGHQQTKVLSYSAKYSSGFYGPFRDAAQSAPSFGDRKTYQMDYRSINQAIGEVAADIEEGTEWVMVKPAHTYLDIIQRIKLNFPEIPLVAYQVSGEYMMIKAAAQSGYLNEEQAMYEALTAIKRAGADYIISYYAKDFARLYNHNCHLYEKIQNSTI